MLVLTRKPGEAIRIDLMEGVDVETPVGELFAGGPIEVTVTGVKRMQVKIGVRAERRFRVLRGELCPLGSRRTQPVTPSTAGEG